MEKGKAENLETIVRILSREIGPRSCFQPEAHERAAMYIIEELEAFGYRPVTQEYQFGNGTWRNIIAELPGKAQDSGGLVIGAHYDTVSGTPGADDNASGMAGVLELARLYAGTAPSIPLRFVAFALEEPPVFRTDNMGSYVYAESLKKKGERLAGMICLEMIGFFSDEPDSQYYPAGFMKWFYPEVGNFISIVSDLSSRGFLERVKKAFMKGTDLPVETLSTLPIVPGIDFSDHRSFWKCGYGAVMVTDTAFYRNPHYHRVSDTSDTLDYARMAKVVDGLSAAVRRIAFSG